ncbi:hypothetical protein [Pseudoxanthomonas kaohsiungensis]|uniref:Uncharacterized protein n=1 Tax=Pseudoxanthomonas kaohsiungensis TaxID=283923 RepID=A0ABW3LXR2_9GAMM|nr:hypothetical protein [Pseudoxanthomonas kaohsiungensis]KAF1702922.1 hypothetical protein CSC66_09105 [Pseudoxanthomonas kaohsiungensis]
MTGIAYEEGPYRYSRPEDCYTKVFQSEDGQGKRTFKVIASTAYDAGIVGSEYNGTVLLDVDNRTVIFDKAGKPYDLIGHRALVDEFAKADWTTFTALVIEQKSKLQPGARSGYLVDGHEAEPAYVFPMPADEDWQVMDVTREGPEDDPYTYPAQKRSEIIAELITHAVHRAGPYDPFRLAWNIKVYDFDTSGKGVPDYEADPQFDKQWEAYLAEHGDQAFYRAQAGALSAYVEGDYTIFPGQMQGEISLGVEGRSGGWMVLAEIKELGKLQWSGQGEMEESLKELSADELKTLYKVVRNLDRDLTRARCAAEMAYQFAYIRDGEEEDWKRELAEEGASPRP